MYKYSDQQVAKLIVLISKAFSNFSRSCKFDNLNDLSKDTKELYRVLAQNNLDAYLDIALNAYANAYYDAYNFQYEKGLKEDKVTKEEARKKALEEITPQWLDRNVISAYSGVTNYVYDREVDRKRARFYEMLVASQLIAQSIKTASNLWVRQTSNYAIETVDTSTLKGYKDSGLKQVIWITESDNKVCADCAELENQVFNIDEVPDKPHPNCRCTIEPYIPGEDE